MEFPELVLNPPGPYVTDLARTPGQSLIDPLDPGYPIYQLLGKLRQPVTLRELMIAPIRQGYIGKPGQPLPKELPQSAAALFPEVGVETAAVRCSDGLIRCQVYRPPGATVAAKPIILYLHGGGFTVGNSEDTAAITSRLARDTDCLVVSVNYRMAPEWPFPHAINDAFQVYAALQKQGDLLKGDSARITVAGDSAGGNLAAALPFVARDQGLEPPRACLLFCPITDFHAEDYPAFERLAPHGIVYDLPFFGFIRAAYLPQKATWKHPYASPAFGNLTDFPSTFLVSGTADPVIDDNRAFAAKLQSAGVDVEYFERPNMPHGYYFFPGLTTAGEEALAAAGQFVLRVLRTTAAPNENPG